MAPSDKFKKRTPQQIAKEFLAAPLPITYPLEDSDSGITYTSKNTLAEFLTGYLKGLDTQMRVSDAREDARKRNDTKAFEELDALVGDIMFLHSDMQKDDKAAQAKYEADRGHWESRRYFPRLVEIIQDIAAGKKMPREEKALKLHFIGLCADDLKNEQQVVADLGGIGFNQGSRESLGDFMTVLERSITGSDKPINQISPQELDEKLKEQKAARTPSDAEDTNVLGSMMVYEAQSKMAVLNRIDSLLTELSQSLVRNEKRGRG